jgi:hypothetical protein
MNLLMLIAETLAAFQQDCPPGRLHTYQELEEAFHKACVDHGGELHPEFGYGDYREVEVAGETMEVYTIVYQFRQGGQTDLLALVQDERPGLSRYNAYTTATREGTFAWPLWLERALQRVRRPAVRGHGHGLRAHWH